MYQYIKHTNSKEIDLNQIGGKAKHLYLLKDSPIDIPSWCVLPADVLIGLVDERNNTIKIPESLLQEIKSFFEKNGSDRTYAVRSSSLNEDGEKHSYAGIYKSHLNISFNDIEKYILDVLESLNSVDVSIYSEMRGSNDGLSKGMAVIIQEQLYADISGVAFGMNPVSGKTDETIINAVYGLGEGLVSGELTADSYKVKESVILETHVATKDYCFKINKSKNEIQKVEVNDSERNTSVLSKDQIIEVEQLLERTEEVFNQPQDIEISYVGNKLYLLQSRPVTTTKNEGEYILWDNSNIIESYPGVTTPLTFSFISMVYESVYKQFVQLMGVRKKEIEEHSEVFANTLGLVRGRVYYNLLNWYKMLAMAPGFSLNARFMETMMGVKERFELNESYQMSKGLARRRVAGMIINIIGVHKNLKKERKKFLKHLSNIMQEYDTMDFSSMNRKELIEHYKHFEESLILEWKAPLINDFFSMVWFGLLQKQSEKYFPHAPNIHNNLLCGSQDIISVLPMRKSMEIADKIREEPKIKDLFLTKSSNQVLEALKNPEFSKIKKLIDNYLHEFGNRCIGELKLETISYTQDPGRFIQLIQNYIKEDIHAFSSENNLEEKLRKDAEQEVQKTFRFKPLRRIVFRHILKKARDLISNRENLRYERTRVFGMVRKMYLEIGEKLNTEGKINTPRDVFYLKREEILAFDSKIESDFKTIIETRKKEFNEYAAQPDPKERFYTYGKDFSDEYIYSSEKIHAIEGDLQGIGCCPGKVEGKVFIVKNPEEIDSLNGDILVTSSTDPGWIKLFPSCSAIIVERGSLLSHSAIVSREMGIPCIVAVDGLLRTLKTGDQITMDGSTGKIQIHK